MNEHTIQLFILKCAVIETGIRAAMEDYPVDTMSAPTSGIDPQLDPFIRQFTLKNKKNAAHMSRYYEMFYLLENDIRRLIIETMEAAHGFNWRTTHVPQAVLEEIRRNRSREAQAAVSIRSEDDIDYTTFGQLGDIIRDNWSDFAGMLSNPQAVSRVFAALNMLRGTIAHCGVLADDEVDRLKLAIRDWFRVLEGPKN
jgi:hypothetical protein